MGDDATRAKILFVVSAEEGGGVGGCAEFDHCGAGAFEYLKNLMADVAAFFQAGPDIAVNVERNFAA